LGSSPQNYATPIASQVSHEPALMRGPIRSPEESWRPNNVPTNRSQAEGYRQGSQYGAPTDGVPAVIPNDPVVRRPSVRGVGVPRATAAREKARTTSNEESESEMIEATYDKRGGITLFPDLVVINDKLQLGAWTGFNWKPRSSEEWRPNRLAHDANGRLWSVNSDFQIGKLLKKGWKSFGVLGHTEVMDLAFDKSNRMWAVTLSGELVAWNTLCWDRKNYSNFRKIKSVAFDRKGGMWALSASRELGFWNEQNQECDLMDMPPAVHPTTIAFDNRNNLWCVGTHGELAQLSGSRWINFGYLSMWKLVDLSFR